MKFAFDPRNADPLIGREEIIQDRSSSGTFFNLNENAIIASLDQRISRLMNLPIENGEGLQILNCQVGSVVPKKGSAVYFEYTNQQGRVDRLSLHAGEPVRSGEKWIATKWMRQGKYAKAN